MDYRTDVGYETSHQAAVDPPGRNRQQDKLDLFRDMTDYFQRYARERPEVVAGLCFGLGFVLGWRLKPW